MLVLAFGGETMVSAESPANDNNDNRNNGKQRVGSGKGERSRKMAAK